MEKRNLEQFKKLSRLVENRDEDLVKKYRKMERGERKIDVQMGQKQETIFSR